MKSVIGLIGLIGLIACTPVRAADMVLKATPQQRILQSYEGTGWYFGVHTFAENQKLDAGNGLGGAFAVGGAVGLTAGWMRGSGGSFQAIEVMASYKNIDGSVPQAAGDPIAVNSKWSFTERVKFGGPVDVMLAMIPNVGTLFPAFPAAPTGGVGLTHPYLFGAFHQDDISQSVGVPVGRAWKIKGGFGVGLMQTLGKSQLNPNGSTVVVDVWAEYIPPASTITVGAPVGVEKTNQGREVRIGSSVLF
jgi:hypothetical protein